MPTKSGLQQLRALNQLLGQLNGAAPNDRVAHADVAYRFFANQNKNSEDISLQRAANALVRLHLELDPHLAGRVLFEHWHAADEPDWGGPLWIRPILLRRLNRLAGAPVVLFLITGLKEAICPKHQRWTRARRSEYARIRHWIDSIALRHHPEHTRIQMIVI
jgi:hypothetical protein